MATPVKVMDLTALLGQLVPLHYAEPWDNVGLLAGDPDREVRSVLLAIDLTLPVVDEALEKGAQMVLCYHPPIFEGLKRIVSTTPVGRALSSGLALYSFHTAFDAVKGGVNDALASVLGLVQVEPIRPFLKESAAKDRRDLAEGDQGGLRSPDHGVGMGRMGTLKTEQNTHEFLQHIKNAFQLPQLLVAGLPTWESKKVQKIAVAAGAGGDLLKTALARGADVFVTGEVRHHDALMAVAQGMLLVFMRHSASERHALLPLRTQLQSLCPQLSFEISQKDVDPFDFY